MFSHKHYVPVLKGKRAEFPAVGSLKSKANVTPLFEAVPSSAPEEIPRRMSAIWENDSPYYVDFFFLDDPDDTADPVPGTYPLLRCFAEVAAKGQNAIPVTGLSRSQTYQLAIAQITSEQGNGVGVRLVPDDFEDVEVLEDSLGALRDFLTLKPEAIDLFLDVGSVFGSTAPVVAQLHRANLELLPDLQRWRGLTVVASAFPLSLAPLVRNEWNPVSRNDWRGWRLLVAGPRRPPRLPGYGDYTIAHPQLPPEGRATILAQLRYATEDSWLIWKGYNVFTHPIGYNQFLGICSNLVARPEYRGASFSEGDNEIYEKATTGGSSGNAESRRRIGTNHHLETVLGQIANLP
jgi:hypothetical protein